KYEGQKIIVEGEGFTNNLVSYDSFTPGTAFAEDRLAPFAVQLEDFDVVFDRESEAHYGQALEYTATMNVTPGPGEEPYQDNIKVNRSEEHTSELQSRFELVCRLLLEKKKTSTS